MNGEGVVAKQPDDIFQLPLNEYLRKREDRCRNALKLLGLYDVNRDLAPMVMGFWYKDYYAHKLKELGHVV